MNNLLDHFSTLRNDTSERRDMGNKKKTLINREDCKMVAAKFIASLRVK